MSDFDDLMKKINKRYGNDSFVQASKSKALRRKQRIRTGILALDLAMGGGVPLGTVLTLKGEFSSGKSALAHRIGGAFNRHCKNCGNPMQFWQESLQDGAYIACCEEPQAMKVVWLDAEASFQSDWAEMLGMRMEHTYVLRNQFAEQAIDAADAILRSGECDLLVVDSVAALTPSIEIEQSSEKWQVGVHARLMNKAMRKFVSAQNAYEYGKRPPTIILINQIRMKVGVFYGSPETSPGGKGIDFASSIICKVKRKSYIEDVQAGSPFGQNMEVTIQKNKTAPPNKSCLFSLYFRDSDEYVAGSTNIAEQIIAIAEYWGFVERAGSWFKLGDQKFQGASNAGKALLCDTNLMDELIEKIYEKEIAWLSGDD
jgi:recombination protein RecA